MEIKIPEAMPLVTARALDRSGIRMTSYSKYGMGFRSMQKMVCEPAFNEEARADHILFAGS